jgi:2'-5' RNA ligase
LPDHSRRRLFFALWPDAQVRAALAALLDGDAIPRAARRVHPEDLHLTLQFLGPVPDERLAAVCAAAAGVKAAAIAFELNQLGHWPRAQVVWCAPEETPSALTQLVAALGTRLAEAGYPPESRPYRPHITLARKTRRAKDGPLPVPIPWRCADFVLVESLPVADPPRYQVVGRWPLATLGLENEKRTN